MPIALTRNVSPDIEHCELTHLNRRPIDRVLASYQHIAYERCLETCGCRIHRLPDAPGCPDSVFIEDTALVMDELAIITRPGAPVRRSEVAVVETAIARHRSITRIEAPATLDGGDVMRIGRELYVGLPGRTNAAAVEQLREHLEPHGYRIRPVALDECLHLKSAVTPIGDKMLLINPDWIDPGVFAAYRLVEVDPGEPHAANALRIVDEIVYPDAFPRTRARLDKHGLRVHGVDVSELAKAEGGVTCCSLIYKP